MTVDDLDAALFHRAPDRPKNISTRWSEHPNLVPGCRVLLAGDGRETRAHLATAAARLGCEVIEFREWQELVQRLRETAAPATRAENDDIVILDLRLSGRRLLDRVLSVTGGSVPLVLVTGQDLELPETSAWTVLRDPVHADDLGSALVSCALQNGRRGGNP